MNETLRRNELFDFFIHIVEEAKKSNLEGKALARFVSKEISRNFGGEMVYIPKDSAFLRQAKHQDILSEFDGTNHRELARKYGVSMQAIYHILKRG